VDRVKNKVAIVTGAATGIGQATAQLLAAEGAKVVVTTGSNVKGGEETVAAIRESGGEAIFVQQDVTVDKDWQRVIDKTLSTHGGLDILVNNAGTMIAKKIEETSIDDWRRLMKVNTEGVFLGTKHGILAMKDRGGGCIVNMSSVLGIVGHNDFTSAYGASKGAIRAFTKGAAVEGTAIIAREFGSRLQNLGLPPAEIETCRGFLDNISVLPEAAIAVTVNGVSAMHDVTEGGLATALEELSIAGNHRIRIDMHKIPVYSETARICGLLGLDPMGLIGSGSLLLCCRQYACDQLLREIRKAGIEVSVIGEIREPGKGIDAQHQLQPVTWPRFEADEITRLFSA